MSLFAFLFGCSRSELVEGGLYYMRNDNGSYSVLKILKLDEQGIHIRLYSNQFPTPPTKLDESVLYMVGLNRKPNETLGMGHAPILRKSFPGWHATFFQQSKVTSDELEGYKLWLDAKGGYF
jgi:hypothetical protein